jgi:hypothetical protein
MNRTYEAIAGRVITAARQEMVAPEHPIVDVPDWDQLRGAQPGMIVPVEVLEVRMRIDDRQIFALWRR